MNFHKADLESLCSLPRRLSRQAARKKTEYLPKIKEIVLEIHRLTAGFALVDLGNALLHDAVNALAHADDGGPVGGHDDGFVGAVLDNIPEHLAFGGDVERARCFI